ncbi:MAG: hypothetical protein JO031_11385 [Ktedonobacteraceae bacterium]|nr:hypothetical protein [Ktedonobacteraceae bacterium]
MSKIFENMRLAVGFGLTEGEMYNRAFEKGVLMKDFARAAQLFDEAAKRSSERGNSILATQAAANALLYRYLTTHDGNLLNPLLRALSGLQEIERIGLQMERIPTGPLCAELDCRLVEFAIAQAQDDALRLRDLHKLASTKFQAILSQPLITYEYVRSGVGHDEKASERHFYHLGMYQFYEAMMKKDRDPSAAVDDLALAAQAFRRCEDATWTQRVATLLDNWRIARTCWLCHREVQGYELHFTMCRATVTPYTQHLLESLNQDASAASLEGMKVAVCTPCGSMITFKAAEEAEKVRKEMTAKFDMALSRIQKLEERVNKLQIRY